MSEAQVHAAGQDVDVALIGMPAWDTEMPYHALVVVSAVAVEAGAKLGIHDLNIEFYHQINEADRRNWTEDMNSAWFAEELPSTLWNRYESWMLPRLDKILASNPKMIAFSVNMSGRSFSVYAARYFKSKRPDIPIMFGGVDCFPGEAGVGFLSGSQVESEVRAGGFVSLESLSGNDGAAAAPVNSAYCDIICQGESEIAFRDFLHDFLKTGIWRTSVPGFAYLENGAVHDTGQPELHDLVQRLPRPRFDLFDLSQYQNRGFLPFFFTRGCPYTCQFCSETVNYRSFRYRRAEEAMEELLHILPHAQKFRDIPTLRFSDSIFNAHAKEFEKFVDLILANNVKVYIGAQGHIHKQMTTEYLEKIYSAGFRSIFWGIESGSQDVVDLMQKAYQVSDARRIISDCSRIGIRQDIPILIGFPGEQPEHLVETVEFMMEYQVKPHIHFHQPVHVIVRKNTPLKINPEHHGILSTEDYEWASADGTNTLPIRIARRLVMRQVHGNRDLSVEGLVDTEEIKAIAFDAPNVADDLFRLLYVIHARAQTSPTFLEMLAERWPEAVHANGSSDIVRDVDQARAVWMSLAKDTPEGRDRIYSLMLACLKALREKVLSAKTDESVPAVPVLAASLAATGTEHQQSLEH